MSFYQEIKNWLIRTLVVLISFLCFTVSSISVSANPISYEPEYHSYSSIDLKSVEAISAPTSQNLKAATTSWQFLREEYVNITDAERNAAKTGMTDLQLLTRAAQKAEAAIGGTEGVAGTLKHTYAKSLLSRYQSIYGDRGFSLGSNYFKGPAGKGFYSEGLSQSVGKVFTIHNRR